MKNRLLFLFIVLISNLGNLGNCSFCTAQNQQGYGMNLNERCIYANQVILPKVLKVFPFLVNDTINYRAVSISDPRMIDYWDSAYSYDFVNQNDLNTVEHDINEDDGFSVIVSNDFHFNLGGLTSRGTAKGFLPAFYNNKKIVTQELSTDPQNVNARFFANGRIRQLYSNTLSNRRFTNRAHRGWDNTYTSLDTLRIDSLKLSIAGEITEIVNITNKNENQYLVANINYTPNPSGGSLFVQLTYQLYTAANGVVWSYYTPLDSVYNYVISPTTVSDINKDKDCELKLLFYKKDRQTDRFTSVILIFVANKKTYMLTHNDGEGIDPKQLDTIPIEYRNEVNLEWRKIVNEFNFIKMDPISITQQRHSLNHDVSCYMPTTTVDSDRMLIECFEYNKKKKDLLFIARKGKLFDNKIYGDIHMGAEEEFFLKENTNLIMHSKSFAIPRKKGSNQDAMMFQFTLDNKVITWLIPYNLSSKDIMYIKHHIPSDKIIYILDKYAHPDDFSNYLRITNAFLREEERSNKNDSTKMNELPLPNKTP